MVKFSIFSLIYLAIAVAFAAIGFAQYNYQAWLAAGLGLVCAIASSSVWWRRNIINLGEKNNLIIDLISIFLIVATQAFGIITDTYGWSYLLIGALILVLVSRVEDTVVISQSNQEITH